LDNHLWREFSFVQNLVGNYKKGVHRLLFKIFKGHGTQIKTYISRLHHPLLKSGVLLMELCDEYLDEDESEGFRYICCRNSQRAAEIAAGRADKLNHLRNLLKRAIHRGWLDLNIKVAKALMRWVL